MEPHSPYREEYQKSVKDPQTFWKEQADKIDWYQKPTSILKQDGEKYTWFEDGILNTSYLALDYHLENGRGDQDALIYDSPVTNQKKRYTYSELQDQVAKFAGGLSKLGITKGDRVIIYMPMVPEAVIAMLACARLGAIHSVVFGGFAPHELAIRIDDAKPKAIISATCGIEVCKVIPYLPMLKGAIDEASFNPEHRIILQRPEHTEEIESVNGIDFYELLNASVPVPPTPIKSTDPLYILYTSGTTGQPKGIVRDNGGHAVALKYSLEKVYGVSPGEVYWAASDVGWVVGHSYIVYAPLIHGCTTILYEGKPIKTPDAGVFWRIIEEYQVNTLFTAPTAFRAIRKEDFHAELLSKYDISSLKNLFLAGERCDPATYEWAKEKLQIPVIDHWWQTETGWPIVANMVGLERFPTKAGSATKAVPGYDVQILSEDGQEVSANTEGYIAIKLPMPPGCLPTLWQNEERFKEAYLSMFEGYYATGDGGYKDEEGYVYIMGRVDDVINVSGHRLSTGEMEEIVSSHELVAECAVIGIHDDLKGEVPLGIVVMKGGHEVDIQAFEEDLIHLVREKIGPIACFKKLIEVDRLPKTRSGKILRKTMRQMVNGHDFSLPSTIDDPAILDEIEEALKRNNLLSVQHA